MVTGRERLAVIPAQQLRYGFIGGGTAKVGNPTRVLITIDVEDPYYPREMYRIWGGLRGGKFGITAIMDILDDYGFKGIFFVDVYERELHSEERMAAVLRCIDSRGHEVQLHTHPGVDIQRFGLGGMAGRSLKRQVEIIEYGAQIIEKYVGKGPLAHRAGSYKADIWTLEALSTVGIRYDSSLFYKNPGCKIDTGVNRYNDLVRLGGVIEVPVSTVRVVSPLFTVLMKLDIEQDIEVLTKGLAAIHEAGAKTAVVFLHSWSFLQVYSARRKPRPGNITKLRRLCEFIKSRPEDYIVCGFEELHGSSLPDRYAVEGFPEVKLSQPASLRIICSKALNRLEYVANSRRIVAVKREFGF